MADDQRPGLLERLFAEMEAKAKQEASEGDFAVNLRTTGKDGQVNEIEGVPFSKVKRWAYDNFGIGDRPDEGDGDEGKGDEGKGDGKVSPFRSYFGQGGQGKTG